MYTIKIKLTEEQMKKIVINHLVLEGQIDQRIVDECDIQLSKDSKSFVVEVNTPNTTNE